MKPELFTSYSIAKLSLEARLLFVGLFTEADDYGRMIDSPKRIAGAIFPHDSKITDSKVDKWLADLEKVGCIRRYEAEGGRYIDIPSWDKHQKISHKGKDEFPKCPETYRNPSGNSPEDYRRITGGTPETCR